MTGRVGVGKPHVGAGETVELRGFVEGAALDSEIAPAEVVGEDEDDVGFLRRGGGVRGCRECERRSGGEEDSGEKT